MKRWFSERLKLSGPRVPSWLQSPPSCLAWWCWKKRKTKRAGVTISSYWTFSEHLLCDRCWAKQCTCIVSFSLNIAALRWVHYHASNRGENWGPWRLFVPGHTTSKWQNQNLEPNFSGPQSQDLSFPFSITLPHAVEPGRMHFRVRGGGCSGWGSGGVESAGEEGEEQRPEEAG